MKASLRGSPLDGDLWSYERVVWRDVIAAFGLVPDPKKCWSKPTHPRTVKRKNCFWDDVHGLINGSVTFQPWDLWWWRDARDWSALVQRYMSAYKDLPRNVRRELAERGATVLRHHVGPVQVGEGAKWVDRDEDGAGVGVDRVEGVTG